MPTRPDLGHLSVELFPVGLTNTVILFDLAEAILATLVGAFLYKE